MNQFLISIFELCILLKENKRIKILDVCKLAQRFDAFSLRDFDHVVRHVTARLILLSDVARDRFDAEPLVQLVQNGRLRG